MKKILILGGTLFVGRVVVEHLLKTTSHAITLFNRSRTRSELFPEVRRITGDRYVEEDFARVCREDWDCIIDTSGYFPDAMERELRALEGRVGRIVFISSISALVRRKSCILWPSFFSKGVRVSSFFRGVRMRRSMSLSVVFSAFR